MTSYRFFHDNGSSTAAKCPTKNGTWMHTPQSGIGVTSFSHASWLKHAQHIVKIMVTPSLPLDVWLSVASHGKGNSCLHPVSRVVSSRGSFRKIRNKKKHPTESTGAPLASLPWPCKSIWIKKQLYIYNIHKSSNGKKKHKTENNGVSHTEIL